MIMKIDYIFIFILAKSSDNKKGNNKIDKNYITLMPYGWQEYGGSK